MALQKHILVWRGGMENFEIDTSDTREMTEDELQKIKKNQAPFVDEKKEWIDCDFARGMKHLVGRCVRVVRHLKEGK